MYLIYSKIVLVVSILLQIHKDTIMKNYLSKNGFYIPSGLALKKKDQDTNLKIDYKKNYELD